VKLVAAARPLSATKMELVVET